MNALCLPGLFILATQGLFVHYESTGQAVYRIEYPLSTSPYAGSEWHLLVHSGLSCSNHYL